ncbi:hypothetical protein [Vulcanisaeta sp. JCM 16161]|uniref:hypothetical protein n=1 Tax=Vulcanisaeta sp. JCM 16161 TaxID=1295372 RepID=UPI000A89A32A|nr:hypothetical protein [Vulcanisaeta sp. JCM 16161]
MIIDIYPRESMDRVIPELNNWFRSFAGKDAIGVEPRIIAKYEGRGSWSFKYLTIYLST